MPAVRMPNWGRASFLVIFAILSFSAPCQAAFVNRTIDDSFGDTSTGFKPIYYPSSGHWEDQTCLDCAIRPNRLMAHDGTWTAAVYEPGLRNISVTLEFTGVAIWVYFILANANELGPAVATHTNCNFTLDGSLVGTFVHNPDMSTLDLVYNATVFSATGLSDAPHQLIISTSEVPFNVFVNFDYAIYTAVTTDQSSNQVLFNLASRSQAGTSSSNSVASIVGAVLGGLALVILLIVLYLLRKSAKSHREQALPMPPLFTLSEQARTGSYSDNRTNTHSPFPSSYTDANTTAPLLSVRKGARAHVREDSRTQEELRAQRQMEIDRRLRSAQREMESLTSRQSILPPPPQHSSSGGSVATQEEMQSLREQIGLLRDQIEHLQTERQSDWAMGLSDEPPPAYA